MPDTQRTRLAVNFPGRTFWWAVFSAAIMGGFADWAVYGQQAATSAPSYQGMVLDFSATWCGPCQQMSPIVARLEREHLPIRKVDIDQQRALAQQFHVGSIPCFILVVNGKEVQRLEGAQSEATIRQLVARVPQAPPPQIVNNAGTPRNDRRTSPPQFPGKVSAPTPPALLAQQQAAAQQGAAAQLATSQPQDVAQQSAPAQQQTVAVTQPKASSNAGFSFFNRNTRSTEESEPEATEARAKVDDLKLPKFIKATPMTASVRISVTHRASGADLGSGTIISSEVGQTYVLTCGHLFRNHKPDSVIEVDFFVDRKEKPVTFVGKLVRHNLLADVGLISIPTDTPLPAVPVAGTDYVLEKAQQVSSIGCAGGEIPTKQFLKITNINRYKGPHNIECTGVPEQGRSGGGLFDQDEQVIGVCSAADKRDRRGIYAGLKAVHSLLEECKLGHLYQNSAARKNGEETQPHEDPNARIPATEIVDAGEIREDSVAVNSALDKRHDAALKKLAASLGDLGDEEVVFLMPGSTDSREPRKLMILRDAQVTSETRSRR